MPPKDEDQVSEQGTKTVGNQQVSADGKENGPQTDEIILTPGKKIKFGADDPRDYSVEQIVTGINQGKLAREFQSRLDKTQEELKKSQELIEKQNRDIEMLQVNQRIAKIENQSTDDIFSFEGPKEKPTESSLRQDDPIIKDTVSKMSKMEQEITDLKRQREEQIIQEEITRFGQADMKVRKTRYKQKYPTVPDTDIEAVMGNEDSALWCAREAERLAPTDREASLKMLALSTQYNEKAVDELTDLREKHRKAEAKAQRDQEVLTRSNAVKETEVISGKPIPNPQKAREFWDAQKKKTRDEVEKINRLRANTG